MDENLLNKVEKNLKQCKVCNEIKMRVLSGKFDYKNKRYVDETGCAWNGHVCPSCHKNKTKHNMQGLRNERATSNKDPQA